MAARWSNREIQLLIENYPNSKFSQMKNLLPQRTKQAIQRMARILSLKKEDQRNIKFLLSESLKAFYWIGFIFADGWISKNQMLGISVSNKDKEHIQILADELNILAHAYTRKTNFTERHDYVNICVNDRENIPKIMQKFELNERKTINPPNFSNYKFTNEQILSLIIGLIDGDGSISKRKTYYKGKNNEYIYDSFILSIQMNYTWKENLEFINKFLHNYFNIKNESNIRIGNRDSNTVILQLCKKKLLQNLKFFAMENNIPFMQRKLGKIS